MGNDFSSALITPLQAHKLIQFECDENRAIKPVPTSDEASSTASSSSSSPGRQAATETSNIFNNPTGILGQQIIALPNDIAGKIHSALFLTTSSDNVNTIAAASALSSLLIAFSSNSPGLFSSIGFLLCAFLINVSVPLQSQRQSRSQRTVLSRFFVSLCEGVVVAAAICWSRTYLVMGMLLIGAWLAVQLVLQLNLPLRPRAFDFMFLIVAVALAGGGAGENMSPPVMMCSVAAASLTASITLYEIMRKADVLRLACVYGKSKNASPTNAVQELIDKTVGAFIDIEPLFNCGVSRFVIVVTLIAAVFGGASKYTMLTAFLMLFVVESFRVVSLSNVLRTPIFRPVVNVYVDGVFDMCHIGHKNLVNFAATLGNRVIAGVMSDEDCSTYKRPPVMTTDERVAEVKALMNVARVVRGAPCFGLTEEFLRQENIDVVVCGQEYMDKPIEEDKYYHVPRRMGIAVAAPRTGGISTSALIKRIASRNSEDLKAKDKESGGSTVKE